MEQVDLALLFIPGGGEVELESAISKDAALVRYAEEAGKSVQQGMDQLTSQLARGNLNPGIGTKSLGRTGGPGDKS